MTVSPIVLARHRPLAVMALLTLVLAAGCEGRSATRTASAAEPASILASRADSVARARQDSANRAQPGYVIDSILPIDEQVRRFRAGLSEVSRFSGGATSRRALVDSILAGLARHDTTALRRLTITRAEYAWLVYPSSPFAVPPMQQPPQLSWYLESSPSEVGFARLVTRLGGRAWRASETRCPGTEVREGSNTIVSGCVVRVRDNDGGPRDLRLFGPLIEREGRWKVLSWANAF